MMPRDLIQVCNWTCQVVRVLSASVQEDRMTAEVRVLNMVG